MYLHHLQTHLRKRMRKLAAQLEGDGMAGVSLEGRLLRPLIGVAAGGADLLEDDVFCVALLAIQYAHEASLVHDDVVDGATVRRGAATLVAEKGVAAALVEGDHLLATAYRAASFTGHRAFMQLFAHAVERTVAGERAQARAGTMHMGYARYESVALGKSGELIGCALAASATLSGRADAHDIFECGRRIGLLYQMFDDVLDYCPHADTGKSALSDFTQRRFTWVNVVVPDLDFDLSPKEAMALLHTCGVEGQSVLMRCAESLSQEAERLKHRLAAVLPSATMVWELIDEWVERARHATSREAALACVQEHAVHQLEQPVQFMAHHSRSFRFASRFFDRKDAERVARVYAFCRATDNLVDRASGRPVHPSVLEAWHSLARQAYDGHLTGFAPLDTVMCEAREAGVPFEYIGALVDGMRMDLGVRRYRTWNELAVYTHRVASVVGLWLTRLHGIADPRLLDRAERLGHAMQLTNIARDVGEDWSQGRLYLPQELLEKYGVTEQLLDAMSSGAAVTPAYAAMIEELLSVAEGEYEPALEVLPLLPGAFARPVAVAAQVYRGIHREIRLNAYDNFRFRAQTSPATKGRLAVRALMGNGTRRVSSRSVSQPAAALTHKSTVST